MLPNRGLKGTVYGGTFTARPDDFTPLASRKPQNETLVTQMDKRHADVNYKGTKTLSQHDYPAYEPTDVAPSRRYVRGGETPWTGIGVKKLDVVYGTPQSTYASDITRFADSRTDGIPDEPMQTKRKATTADLGPGTTKSTNHIPGYKGFIPKSTNNPDACAHASGERSRPVLQVDMLTINRTAMPGYSGYQPREVVNDRGPRTGAGSLTTSGATYGRGR